MLSSRLVRTTGVALLLAGLAPLACAADADYEAGLREAQAFHYTQALAHFDRAAARGDREALRTAGLMLFYGEDLYGQEVHKDWIKAVHLLSEAADKGCRVSANFLRQIGVRDHG